MQETPENNTSNLPLIFNGILLSALIGVGVASYIYGNFDGVSKKELDKNYLKKTEISFYDLDYNIQKEYIELKEHNRELQRIKDAPSKIEYKDKIVYQDKIIEKEKIVYQDKIIYQDKIVYQDKIIEKEPKIEIVEKVVRIKQEYIDSEQDIENILYKNSSTKDEFNLYKCYGMEIGSYYLTKECEDGIKKFIENNKESKFYEVISFIDANENRIIDDIKDSSELNLDFSRVQKLDKLFDNGLAKQREIETIQEIKKYVPKNIVVTNVGYIVKSDTRRGTAIRAYK